jgi:all-trans-retinol 13,14-reductase
MNRYDFAIIGSGLGSLLCGAILSREGFSVCVLEKQPETGGCLQGFSRSGNYFDTGIHYLGSLLPGQTLHFYWKYFGLADIPDLERMDSACFDKICLGEREYQLAQGFDAFSESLCEQFGNSSVFVGSFVEALKSTISSFPLYNSGIRETVNKTIWMSTNAWDFANSLPGADKADRVLKQVLFGNNFLYAGRKSSTPWHQVALINHSFISSAWRLRNGSGIIASLLAEQIRSNGGHILTRKQISRISVVREKFHLSAADGDMFVATQVIGGIHPQNVISLLDESLVRRSFRQRIMQMGNTVSSFGVYLGLKPGVFPYLEHNLYHHGSDDVWDSITANNETWPGMYFLYTPPHARDNGFSRSLCVLTFMTFDEVRRWENTTTGRRGPEYKAFKADMAEKLIKMVNQRYPELDSAIESIEVSTPLTWRDYTGTPGGAMYGIEKDSGNYMHTMLLPRSKVPGLFFTGQNLNLHGAPGVTIGAVMTCAEILGADYLFQKFRDAQ